MKILDRYLARQFVRTFLIFLCSFTGLYIVIDFFGNIEEFLEYADIRGSMIAVLAEYYGYRTLSFFNWTSGVLSLISAMFTVTAFQRGNELTAVTAAGVARRRAVLPIFLAAAGVSALAVANRELVLPSVRDRLSRNAQDWLGEKSRPLSPRYDNKTNISLGGRATVARTRQIENPNFLLPRGLDEYGRNLTALAAFYQPAESDRPAGYLLRGVTQPRDLAQRESLQQGGKPVVLTPGDTKWLAENECFVVSDVSFEQLAGGSNWREFASTAQLISGLHNASLDFGADVRVAVHARLLQPFLDVTLLLLGLPLVLTRENRNGLVAVAMCGLVVVGFMVTTMACHYLGTRLYIDPALAAWLPLAIFVPAAVYLSQPLFAE
jgi:lipopolysaccharide export system permease protein